MSSMNFNFISLFSELIESQLQFGIVGQAYKKSIFTTQIINPRQFTSDVHKTVDDRPFGGGDGMVMLAEPLKKSIESLGENAGHKVYLSATGKPWKAEMAKTWSNKYQNITFVCGRYGGVDQRFINECIDEEICVGDFVVSGGELPALMVMDSIVRFIPQVLGHADSAELDSFSNQLLEAPQFTRPQIYNDSPVPYTLTNGDHKKILELKQALSVVLTYKNRPDLLSVKCMSSNDIKSSFTKVLQLNAEELNSCGFKKSELEDLLKGLS